MRRALLVLVVAAAAFAGEYDLLICHTDPGSTSGVVTNIGGYPGYDSVTLLDCTSTTPSVDTLGDYGCIFTWSNYAYQDPTGMGNNLADYMDYYTDSCGGVVSCCFAHYSSPGWGLGGRYVNDANYCPVTMGGTYYSTTALGSKDDSSYVIDGYAGFVTSINGIYYGEYIYKESPATWVADCTNGYILAAVNADENAVGVNMYPGDYRYWYGDGWILYNNAIMYMMEGWWQPGDPPYVTGMDPDDGDTNVPLDSTIVFHCVDDLSKVDLDTIAFSVEDQSRRSGDRALRAGSSSLSTCDDPRPVGEISGTLDLDDTDPKDILCTFTPDSDLPVDLITCIVAAGLADDKGWEMQDDFIWTFTTEGYPNVERTTWGAIKAEF